MKQVCLNIDRSERVLYDMPDYPAYIRKGHLSAYPNYTAESHWHDDVEFILILSGHMLYNINGEVVMLREGEGIFVNARQFHFGYSTTKTECVFICVLLHPMLLCSSATVEQKYINPILFDAHVPFCHLTKTSEWKKLVLQSIGELYHVRNDHLAELKIQRIFLTIWIAMCENLISAPREAAFDTRHLSVLKNMILYINRHYKEKLSLEGIARAGSVGKTNCCMIFKKYTNKTPNEYLTELRLRKGIQLLLETDMTVLAVSYEVGFSGAGYFSETFRQYYGCTPSAYRKMNRKKVAEMH